MIAVQLSVVFDAAFPIWIDITLFIIIWRASFDDKERGEITI